MTTNTVNSSVYPMLIQKYNTLIPDPNANVLDKINQIIDYLNQTGKLTNDVVDQWNKVMAWTMNDGLSTDVSNKLETMLSSGEFDTLFQKYIAPSLGDISTLQTADKSSAVNAINEVDQLAKTNQTNLGTLSSLTTTAKNNLVAAINENQGKIATNTANIGTLSNLQTTHKTDLVSAVNDNAASLAAIAYVANIQVGIDPTGVNDSSSAIQNAINYASSNGYKRIKFKGKYRIDKVVNLASNLIYDYDDSQFYASVSSIGYVFYGNGISNFEIIGSQWLQDANSVTVNDMTGVYANYAPFMLTGCNHFEVHKMHGGRLHVGLNIYNSSNFSVHHNYFEDGNAAIAVVAQTGYTASGGDIHDNIIIRCGDDGIFVGSQGGNCYHMDIHDNFITKTTRANGELNGSTTAALGIRVGEYGAGHSSTSKNIQIHHNTLVDMVNGAIFVHDCDTVLIESNIIDGYAKNTSTASPAIQIGEVGMTAFNTKALHNTIKNAYTDSAEFKLGDTNNVLLKGNDFLGGANRTTKLIKTGTQTNVRIKDNYGFVTENYGSGAAFPYTATSGAFVHGLDDITGIEVEVFPMMRMGAAKTITVNGITATAFTIALDAVTGDTNNPTFNWRARSNQ